MAQLVAQGGGGQEARPGRRQFERQGQAIESRRDRLRRREGVRIGIDSAADRACTHQEQIARRTKRERVERFNRSLRLPAYPESGKPRRKYMRAALAELEADASESAILGDQLFTDAYAGKRLGMRAIIFPLIRVKKTPFFRIKRALERGIMHGHGKKKGS